MQPIRLAEINDRKEILAFIDTHWQKNHAYVKNESLFDWTFLHNPNWQSDNYSISIFQNNGAIEGMLGTIPFEFNYYGKSQQACWLVNWLLLPHARKGGTGLKLLKIFSDDYGYDTVSFGINDTIARLYSALKWQETPAMPRCVWINPNLSPLVLRILEHLYPNFTRAEMLDFINERSNSPALSINHNNSLFSNVDPEDWDNRGWGKFKNKAVGCTRDFKYLSWRYDSHPLFEYESRVVDDGSNLGLLIWRIDNADDKRLDQKISTKFKFARVVEFIPNSKSNAEELISSFLATLVSENVAAFDFYCYHLELCSWMRELGFNITSEQTGIQFPNYTQPLATGGFLRSAFKVQSSENAPLQMQDWYWTKSDSDQDRPK